MTDLEEVVRHAEGHDRGFEEEEDVGERSLSSLVADKRVALAIVLATLGFILGLYGIVQPIMTLMGVGNE